MKEDTGQILIVDKIVNNNIVIAKDFRGREVVAIGKGVGFRKRKNEAVHRSEIMKTYVLLDKVDSGVLTLFEEIQFEVIETSQKIIDYAQEKLNVKFNVNLLMSLSDHINFALIQYRQGNHVPKLVNEEVKRFYKEEYHIGEIAVQMINERFQILFPKDEATAIAFHLITFPYPLKVPDLCRKHSLVSAHSCPPNPVASLCSLLHNRQTSMAMSAVPTFFHHLYFSQMLY